ncbi:MAG: MFS transporter [Pseudomonadota bacterium]|nr:MFS transporter [Pseudomonadota bacterium]
MQAAHKSVDWTTLKKTCFTVSLAIVLLPLLAESIYAPGLPVLASNFNISEAHAGQTISIYLFGYSVGVVVWGYISDIIGRRYTIMTGVVLFLWASITCYATQAFSLFLMLRWCQAFGGAVATLSQTLTRDVFNQQERLELSSIMGMIISIAPGVGTVLGGVIVNMSHWRDTFILLSVLAAGLLWFITQRLPETKRDAFFKPSWVNINDATRGILQDGQLWLNGAIIGLGLGIFYIVMTEGAFFYILRLGLTRMQFSYVVAASAVSYAMGCKLCQTLLRYGHQVKTAMGIGLILLSFAYVSQVMLLYLNGYTDTALLPIQVVCSTIVGLAVLGSLGLSCLLTPCFALGLEGQKSNIGMAASWFSLIYNLINAMINSGMNVIHSHSLLTMPLYFCSIIVIIAFIYIRYILMVHPKLCHRRV